MWRFHNPVEIINGEGALGALPDLVKQHRYAIVTYPGALFADFTQTIIAAVGLSPVTVLNQVAENPSVAHLTALCQQLQEAGEQPELFIALGGGSVIDATKVLAASAGDFNNISRFLHGDIPADELPCKPIIAMPTTAGTGSEVTCWSTIWDPENDTKYSLNTPRLYPLAAIFHAPFTVNLPVSVTISSGLDALSHALESLWNKNRNPVSTTFAITAAKTILATLPVLVRDSHNLSLRARMLDAALMAGLAFSNTQTAIAHNISYAVTLETGTPHGIACSFTLPALISAIDPEDDELVKAMTTIFERPTEQAAQFLAGFLHDLDVMTEPHHYGYTLEKWKQRIVEAAQGQRGRNYSGDVYRLLSQY